jgi:hypothetical protein
MAIKTKDELKTLSDSTFSTNGLGQITAENHRAFNDDILDSIAIDTEWINVTDDLIIDSFSLYGNIQVSECNVKRTGDIILVCISANLSISNSARFVAVSYSLDSDIFDLGGNISGGFVVFSESGNLFGIYIGRNRIVFNPISINNVAGDSLELGLTVPYL